MAVGTDWEAPMTVKDFAFSIVVFFLPLLALLIVLDHLTGTCP